MARKSKDWDVRTNLNSTPGSQGTLFSGGTKHMSDDRFARGYTPERQAEVRDAVVPGAFNERLHAMHEIVDNVARSTVPVGHLNNVQFSITGKDQYLTNEENVAGKHMSAGIHMPPNGNRDHAVIGLKENYTRNATVIHEIGHHVSHTLGTEHSAYSTDGQRGHEESFADNYAETHFRDRSGKQVDKGTYAGGKWNSTNPSHTDEFWDQYHAHRDRSLYSAQVHAGNEEYYKQYPEEREHPDGSMDVPLINKSWVSDDEKKRGIKSEATLNPEVY